MEPIVTGPGIRYAYVGKCSEFFINFENASEGYLSVSIAGLHDDIDVTVHYVNDTAIHCSYTPRYAGIHVINISWSNRLLMNSPFVIDVLDAPNSTDSLLQSISNTLLEPEVMQSKSTVLTSLECNVNMNTIGLTDGALLESNNSAKQQIHQDYEAQLMQNPLHGDIDASQPHVLDVNAETADRIKILKSTSLKRHVCFYCGKFSTKVSRHLRSRHKEEAEIIELNLIVDKKKRLQLLNKLVRAGDYHHNIEVLSRGTSELILAKERNKSMPSANAAHYVPCVFCLGFYLSSSMFRHAKVCKQKQDDVRPNEMSKKGKALLLSTKLFEVDSLFVSFILATMKQNEVGDTCLNDALILKYGQIFFQKKGIKQAAPIKRHMRLLGKLLLELRGVTNSKKSLTEFLCGQYFDAVVEAAKYISDSYIDTDDQIYKPNKPTCALNLGTIIRKCVSIKFSDAIKQNNEDAKEEAKNFLDIYASEWQEKVSSIALATLYSRRSAKPYTMPLIEDIQSVRQFLLTQIPVRLTALYAEKTSKNYRNLADVILIRIIVFNRRRSGEASRMLLTDYTDRHKWSDAYNAEIASAMTELERHLCKTNDLVEVIGKGGKNVPVILPQDVLESMELLLSCRVQCNVAEHNRYFFGTPFRNGYIKGYISFNKICKQLDLQRPDLIFARELRRHIGIVCQILQLKSNELEWLSRHLGHNINIHKEFYQLHHSTLELTRVSLLLMIIDGGKAASFINRSLKDITICELQALLPFDEAKNHHSACVDKEESTASEKKRKSQLLRRRIVTFSKSKRSTECEFAPYETASNSEDPLLTKRFRKIRGRMPWSNEENEAVNNILMNFIVQKKLPKKEDAIMAQKAANGILDSRSYRDIIFKVKNTITMNNRKLLYLKSKSLP